MGVFDDPWNERAADARLRGWGQEFATPMVRAAAVFSRADKGGHLFMDCETLLRDIAEHQKAVAAIAVMVGRCDRGDDTNEARCDMYREILAREQGDLKDAADEACRMQCEGTDCGPGDPGPPMV